MKPQGQRLWISPQALQVQKSRKAATPCLTLGQRIWQSGKRVAAVTCNRACASETQRGHGCLDKERNGGRAEDQSPGRTGYPLRADPQHEAEPQRLELTSRRRKRRGKSRFCCYCCYFKPQIMDQSLRMAGCQNLH